ncbi:MAG: hypothetical protein EON51_11145, partial [Acinetobacter sp.]
IVICNHNSFMDIPISTPSIPGANKTIAKIELAKVPVFGAMYTAGSVLVDRKSETSRKESLTKMKKVLDSVREEYNFIIIYYCNLCTFLD